MSFRKSYTIQPQKIRIILESAADDSVAQLNDTPLSFSETPVDGHRRSLPINFVSTHAASSIANQPPEKVVNFTAFWKSRSGAYQRVLVLPSDLMEKRDWTLLSDSRVPCGYS